MNNHNAPVPKKTVLGVHRGIFTLGLVSFLTDLSSEMIFSVFSIFLTAILGASAALLGLIGKDQAKRRVSDLAERGAISVQVSGFA